MTAGAGPCRRGRPLRLGAALAAGNFGGERADGLAVGIPDDPMPGIRGAGTVIVFYATADG